MIGAVLQRFGAEPGMIPAAAGDGGDGAFLREMLRQAAAEPGAAEPDGETGPAAEPGLVGEDDPVAGPAPSVSVPGDSEVVMTEGGVPSVLPAGVPAERPLAEPVGATARLVAGTPPVGAEPAAMQTGVAPARMETAARVETAVPAADGGTPPVARPEGAAAPPAVSGLAPVADPAAVPPLAAPPLAAIAAPPRFAAAPAPPPLPLRLIADTVVSATGRTVELRLWPEELGVLRLALTPEGDSIRVAILAERAETFELLRRHTADLVAEFRALGFGGVQFSFGHGRDRGERAEPSAPPGAERAEPSAAVPAVWGGAAVTVAGLDLRI